MTLGKFRLTKQVKSLETRKPDELMEVPASLGLTIGGLRLVEIPNRSGYVYARIRDQLSEVVQVYNDQVSPIYDLPVIIVRHRTDMNRWRIKGRDLGRYSAWGSTAYLPNHGGQHSFDPTAPGGDIVWTYAQQIMPLAATPSGSSGAMSLIVKDFTYYRNNAWNYFPDTNTASFVSYKPTGSNAAMVLLYLDTSDSLAYLKGTEFAITTGTANIIPNLPDQPADCFVPIAGIYLLSGTSALTWDNIYEARPFFTASVTGSSGGTSADIKAKVSADDTTTNYLENKIVAGAGVVVTTLSPGGNETLSIAVTNTGTAGTFALDDLTDVVITSPASGSSLVYNGSGTWVDGAGGSGGGADTFGTIFPLTPAVSGDFAWVNQIDATVTTVGNKMILYDPANGLVDWHLFVKNIPAAPYKVTIGFIPNVYTDYCAAGMVVSVTGTSKFIHHSLQWRSGPGGATLSVCAMDDFANWNADYSVDHLLKGMLAPMWWLQIQDDTTDRFYKYSLDGVNFRTLYSHGRTTFITPNKIGFGIASYTSNEAVWSTILHYKEE